MTPITRLLLPALLLSVVSGGSACSGGGWQMPSVVKIESEKGVGALLPGYGMWFGIGESGKQQGLLLRDGDYFFAEGPVRYRASDGQDLKITVTDWNVKVGDKVVAVTSDGGKDGTAWLAAASDAQLADVRTLGLGDVDATALLAIRRLAAANPNVDLFAENSAGLAQVLPLFRPRAVFAPEHGLDEAAGKAIASQTGIDTLFVTAEDPGSLAFLSGMPHLRTLLISKWSMKDAGPLPAGLTGLKTLLVMEHSDLADLTPLGAVAPNLESLSLIGLEDFKDTSGVEKMTSLHTLFLWTNAIDLTGLAGLAGLRWVGLPPETSQEQFAAFLGAHPKLAILDMMGNEKVKDLTPLGTLTGLKGLVLDGEFDDLSAVQTLTSLKFLGVSKDLWKKAPAQVAAVQKALPDALVVEVKPLCLGSGWILLLVPVPFVAWMIRRKRLGVRTSR
jgi:hypothetical protein